MNPINKPKIFGGDGVYFGHNEDQGPVWLRYGLWIPLFSCSGKQCDDLKKYLEKYYPDEYQELSKFF